MKAWSRLSSARMRSSDASASFTGLTAPVLICAASSVMVANSSGVSMSAPPLRDRARLLAKAGYLKPTASRSDASDDKVSHRRRGSGLNGHSFDQHRSPKAGHRQPRAIHSRARARRHAPDVLRGGSSGPSVPPGANGGDRLAGRGIGAGKHDRPAGMG